MLDGLGYNFAFGLSAYDGSSEVTEDPDYATIEVKYREWGISQYELTN